MSENYRFVERKLRREDAKESMKKAQKEKEDLAKIKQEYEDKGWTRLNTVHIKKELHAKLNERKGKTGIPIKTQVENAIEKDLEED